MGILLIACELLNAISLSDTAFRIANVPFFIRNISCLDIVKAKPSDVVWQYEFIEVLEESKYTAISIIRLDD